MKEKELQDRFLAFERSANGSRLLRWSNRPLKYPASLIHSKLVYPLTNRPWNRSASTFWGDQMFLPLPAGLDIFLTGGKSHDSEIRLTKWLSLNVEKGDCCMDIGAHVGFFSLWMGWLVGHEGKVFAYEPSKKTFQFLEKNVRHRLQIHAYNQAFSNASGELVFHEFDTLHSEFNSLDPEWHRDKEWMKKNPPKTYHVQAITLDDWSSRCDEVPKVMKIDVEGGELNVIQGGIQMLRNGAPHIVMEVQTGKEKRTVYLETISLLEELGYGVHEIQKDGILKSLPDIISWMDHYPLESDNLVFVKS